jgi:flagellar export protein FliJ
MSFQFSLQAVLRLRQGLYRQQEISFRRALAEIVRLTRQIDLVTAAIRQSAADDHLALQTAVPATSLHFNLRARSTLAEERWRLQALRLEAEKVRSQELTRLHQRRADVEILESLRHTQHAAYRQESDRHEKQALDEVFLLRRQFLNRPR